MDSKRDVIKFCGVIGKTLLESGSEINRTETTVEYIGKNAGVDISCYADKSVIFISDNQTSTSHMVKVKGSNFNFHRIDKINSLSRHFSAHLIDYPTLKKEFHKVQHGDFKFGWAMSILGAGLVSMPPLIMFQASWGDFFLAFFVGIIGYLAHYWSEFHIKQPYAAIGIGGAMIGLFATTLKLIGIASSGDMIIFGAVMPLVPGIVITNSFREILSRNIVSGLILGIHATIIAGSIGGGVIIGNLIGKAIIGGLL